jgi:hypothetical protein
MPAPQVNAGHHAAGLLQHAFQDLLRAAHFPQDVDVDRALAVRDLVSAADLFDPARDAIGDQLFVPLAPGQLFIDLG